jgi:hypothetical protein
VQTCHEQLDPKSNPKIMAIETAACLFKRNWQARAKTKVVTQNLPSKIKIHFQKVRKKYRHPPPEECKENRW